MDRDGLDGLSMRTVAVELGMSAMALYRCVENRQQLEKWAVEQVLSTIDLALPARTSWSERVVLLMERARAALTAHPAALPLFLAHRHTSPSSLRWIETMLGVLSEAGFNGTERVVAQRSLVSYLLGAVQAAHFSPLSGSGTAVMAGLPSSEFPYLAETARHGRRITANEEFHLGMNALIRGLRAESPHEPSDS